MDRINRVNQDLPLSTRAGQPRLTRDQLSGLLREVAAAGDWARLVRYDPAARWYRRLTWDPGYEVWLLSWLPGQRTGFHDHGGSAGAFTVVHGELTEHTQPAGLACPARVLPAGAAQAFGPRHVHDVGNVTATPAVSIHAYSPPLTRMRRYRLGPAGLVLTAVEAAGTAW
jgi:predicted metal-dependent enzyme (double-stranded beta helix superfamily)